MQKLQIWYGYIKNGGQKKFLYLSSFVRLVGPILPTALRPIFNRKVLLFNLASFFYIQVVN